MDPLYRDGRLTATELGKRLRALNDLASGKLRPDLTTTRPPRAIPNPARFVERP